MLTGLVKARLPPVANCSFERGVAIGQVLCGFGALLCVFSIYGCMRFVIAVRFNDAVVPRVCWLSWLWHAIVWLQHAIVFREVGQPMNGLALPPILASQ